MLEFVFRLDKNTAEGLYERDETLTTRIFFFEARFSPQPIHLTTFKRFCASIYRKI